MSKIPESEIQRIMDEFTVTDPSELHVGVDMADGDSWSEWQTWPDPHRGTKGPETGGEA